jgi:hypothetical protein
MPILSPHKRWVVKQILYRDLLTELDGHFTNMDVRYMPIKGAYLILAGLAERIDAREMLDVDILVDRENFDAVCDYFARCPNTTVEDDPWYFERTVWYHLGSQRLRVEIHYLLNRPERFILPPQELFARGLQKGTFLWLPGPEDALAIAVCHALVHIAWSGLREAVFDDVSVLARMPDFAWPRFETIMAQTGIMRFRRFLFLLLERKRGLWLPGLEKRIPFWMKLLAGIFMRRYGRMPVWLQRLLFEIPFVRDPWRMIR